MQIHKLQNTKQQDGFEQRGVWNQVLLVYVEVLSQGLRGETEGNQK